MAQKKLRIGMVGAGFMGRAHSNAYRQVRHFFDVPFELECRAVCARNRENLTKLAATWGWAETTTEWEALIDRPDIDVIDIAAPNAMHAPIAIRAAEAGKTVWCEKPLSTNLPDAERIAAAARGVPTMVWYNYRRVPAISFAKRLVDDGRIGRAFHYRATYLQESGNDPTRPPSWKTIREHAGSGVLGDLLSHVVDSALWLNGAIREVSGMMQTFADGRDVDDATLALVRFANGSVGTFEATRYATGCRNRNGFEMHGQLGMLRFNLEDMNHIEFFDATEPRNLQAPRRLLVTGPDHPYAANFWKPGHIIGYEHTFIAALGDFLGALAEGRPFHPDFEDGLRVEKVLDAVQRSARTGRWMEVEQA